MSSPNWSLAPGQVVELVERGRFVLAVLLAADASGKRWRVVDEEGRERLVMASACFHDLPLSVNPERGAARLAEELHKLRRHAEALAASVSLETAWAIVREQGEAIDNRSLPGTDLARSAFGVESREDACPSLTSITAQELALLLFGSAEAAEQLATSLALRADRLFFKQRGPALLEAREPDTVQALQRDRTAAAAKADELDRFALWVEETLAQPLTPERTVPPDVEPWLLRFERDATWGAEHPERRHCEQALGALRARLGARLAGLPKRNEALASLALLVALGRLDRDDNLLLRRYERRADFDEACLAEADQLAESSERLQHERADATDLEVVSIDDVDTLDIDDALSLEAVDGARWRLGVHIAAPAAVLRLGGALEGEARRRVSSLYLPDQTLPMLPEQLAHGRLALVAGARRPALSFFFLLDEEGGVADEAIRPTWIHSRHKLSYSQVDAWLEAAEVSAPPALAWLGVLDRLLTQQRRRREASVALCLNLPERKLRREADGTLRLSTWSERSRARRLVAEAMVLTNAAAARWALRERLPIVYRAQDAPNLEQLQALRAGLPEGLARDLACMRLLPPTRSSLVASPHRGLGLPAYTQVTSPIRRYPDLLAHFQLEAQLAGRPPPVAADELAELLPEIEAQQAVVREIEREGQRYWTLRWLEERVKLPLEAEIVAHSERSGAVVVMLLEPMFRATLDHGPRQLPLGSRIHVVVELADARAGELRLRWLN